MGFFNRSNTDDGTGEYGTAQITSDWPTVTDSVPDAIRVRPYKEHDGIQTAIEFLRDLHDPPEATSLHGGRDTIHSFEVRYTAGRVNFQFVGHNDWWTNNIKSSIQRHWPSAQTERTKPRLVNMNEGRYVAAAELGLKKYTLYPIKHIGIEGFQSDPFGSIISRMGSVNENSNTDKTDVSIQVLFQPVDEDWTRGVNGGYDTALVAKRIEATKTRRGGKILPVHKYEVEPSDTEKKAAKLVRRQDGEMGWRLVIRVIATSDNPQSAADRVDDTAGMFRKYYNSETRQNFVTNPVAEGDLQNTLDRAVNRTWSDATIVKSLEETAGLVHVPNSDINQQNVQWALSRAGYGVPPGTPRFDFEEAGVALGSDDEQQTAMFNSSSQGKPFWFGMGSRNGIEAGVEEDVLKTHMFVGGESGYGKTTFAGKNLFKQIVDRGYGTLMYDPKGMDAEDIASLVPEEREDDLVFIELGSEREHQVGFNFLEVPGNAEPGTPEHSAALESMADDLEAILPLASGVHGEGSWGTRMSRIARNIARGLGKLDREPTLYDAHLIANTAAGREAYASALDEEEVNFIKDYAINHLQEMDDDALEPFAGRLQQLIENDTVREIVTLKDGFSIDDAVADGKIIIVQDNDSSKTTGKMVATALIRRIWVSIREQTYDDDRPDPDQFYAILDEFKEIATVNSDVAEIFADARSFGLSMIVMTQDLSSQLSDEIMEAVEGQAETFITFNPGREADARIIESQHSKDMEYDDLLELPKYRFLMRTHDEDGELTHSYKVQAFPPIDEIPGMARSEEETKAMIDRRIEEVGSPRRTDEEIMSDTALLSGSTTEEDDSGFEVTDHIRMRTCKAVYDESIRQDSPDGWVALSDAQDRIRRYLPDDAPLGTTAKLCGDLLELIPESHLEEEIRDDELHLRCTEEGKLPIFAQGGNQSGGGPLHRKMVKNTYRPLTEAGFVYDIPHQDGESMSDAVARLDDVEILQFDEDTTPKEIHEAYDTFTSDPEYALLNRLSDGETVHVEIEESTGDTAPAQTIVNLAKCVNQGKRCLFVCRTEEIAGKVWDHVCGEPACMRPTAQDGYHRYYNENDEVLKVGGNAVYRPAGPSQTKWLYDIRTDEVVLADSDDNEHARFDDPVDVFSDPTPYPAVEGHIEEYDDWVRVKPPVIPSVAFDDGVDPAMFDVLLVDDGDLMLYEDGDLTPLEEIAEPTTTSPLADI